MYQDDRQNQGISAFRGDLPGKKLRIPDPDNRPALGCYNTRHNNPYKDPHHPRYTLLEKVPHAANKVIGAKTSAAEQVSLDPKDDAAT